MFRLRLWFLVCGERSDGKQGADAGGIQPLARGLDPRSLVAFDVPGKNMIDGKRLSPDDQKARAFVGDLAEPVRYGTDHVTPLLADCGFGWVRSISFDDLALEPKQAWTPVAEFAGQGLDAVNLGPGATRYAHRRDERVEIGELERTLGTLRRFAS